MNTNISAGRSTVIAYFPQHDRAQNAIQQLRDAGFRADQIGCSFSDEFAEGSYVGGDVEQRRSFWEKVGDFFTGHDADTDTDAEARTSSTADESYLRVPDRYEDRIRSGGAFVSVYAPERRAEAEQVLRTAGGELESDSTAFESTDRTGAVEDERRIQLLSERLRVRKERVSQGDVRLRKEVRTERQNIEVPVTREELVVEHVPTSERDATNAEIGSDQEIRVPLSEERVVVEKQPVVRDEVRVAKKPVETTENVADDVRHEELKVDDNRKTAEPKRRKSA